MQTTIRQFDKVAEEYDFVNSLLYDYSFFIENLPLRKGRALDIGCGSGLLVNELSTYFDEVVGVDLSGEMLEIAKAKRQRTNTSYLHMDAEQIDFDKKFDLIVSRTTFHHLNDVPRVVSNMKALLNDGGKIIIVDNVSEVETPTTYVYIIGALIEFFPHLRKFGLKNATRIFKHSTSKPWLEHLASDKYLSEKQYYELYSQLLPNCRFEKMGWAMGIVWTAGVEGVRSEGSSVISI